VGAEDGDDEGNEDEGPREGSEPLQEHEQAFGEGVAGHGAEILTVGRAAPGVESSASSSKP
jgi:hypothetical protein